MALHSCIINDGWVCSGWTLRATSKTIHEKKGRGIFRRIFHHVPSSGPGSINRRIRSAETLDSSSKLHVVAGGHCKNGAHPVGGEGVSKAGEVQTAQLSCYSCTNCSKFEPKTKCLKGQGPWKLGQDVVCAKSQPQVPHTRAALSNLSLQLADECTIGEVVAIESDRPTEPLMIVKVLKKPEGITAAACMTVQKFEPTQPGSSVLRLMDGPEKIFEARCDSIRVAGTMLGKHKHKSVASRSQPSDVKANMMMRLPQD